MKLKSKHKCFLFLVIGLLCGGFGFALLPANKNSAIYLFILAAGALGLAEWNRRNWQDQKLKPISPTVEDKKKC
jgi:hypothetical protein